MSADTISPDLTDDDQTTTSPEPHHLNGGNNRYDDDDSMDRESLSHGVGSKQGWGVIVQLAFQSIGVVYGDIGTSPLYVYASTFTGGISNDEDVLGVLSLIIYTLTLIPLVKYVFIVLRANDNGDEISLIINLYKIAGGTFALYSLICRYAKVGLIPSQQTEDGHVSNFQLELPSKQLERGSKLKSTLENSVCAKYFLLFATMLGTSMVIGDGILTPCISVLSAVGGIKEATPSMTQGTEALFADVGHFTVRSIQLSMCCVTYPALILAYTGQASFLTKHPDLVSDTFYKSIPASIIASQAMISGAFAIIQQSLSVGCFPRVKVVHTSCKFAGQVYIPEVNYLLMVACVGVTVGFQTTAKIGNAYGIAVVFVMTLTSSFLVLIMLMIWKTHILLVLIFISTIGTVEIIYLSSVLYKFNQGGYLPLAFLSRLPGLALFYSELVQGIPPIFSHYLANVPALHSVLVFVSIKSLPIGRVPIEERFLFRRVEPKELGMFRCVARYVCVHVLMNGIRLVLNFVLITRVVGMCNG
ncbi:Potassium transporter 5 [Linum perenne]